MSETKSKDRYTMNTYRNHHNNIIYIDRWGQMSESKLMINYIYKTFYIKNFECKEKVAHAIR